MLCLLLEWQAFLTTLLLFKVTTVLFLMTTVLLLLEHLTVVSRFTLILILLTLLISTTTLQVTKELLLTTQVCSTALTFHYSKLEQSTLTPSNPKLGFKTRYGMVSNPFSQGLTQGSGALTANSNKYYRRVQVANLM